MLEKEISEEKMIDVELEVETLRGENTDLKSQLEAIRASTNEAFNEEGKTGKLSLACCYWTPL